MDPRDLAGCMTALAHGLSLQHPQAKPGARSTAGRVIGALLKLLAQPKRFPEPAAKPRRRRIRRGARQNRKQVVRGIEKDTSKRCARPRSIKRFAAPARSRPWWPDLASPSASATSARRARRRRGDQERILIRAAGGLCGRGKRAVSTHELGSGFGRTRAAGSSTRGGLLSAGPSRVETSPERFALTSRASDALAQGGQFLAFNAVNTFGYVALHWGPGQAEAALSSLRQR